ncbi:MAG: 4-hydroxy-3-methylbut-2-enyl diphosphate reductase [Lachnospiraceae bacterium]|nr:4-hydroxy-3-methylbut-2-enyl diphosphate reductase [Lachnospiraceae bacterium]MCD7767168.1 4-hydroxy-3-methylbut-2-enyl diphosphate reductase [Lachnospiraceae bacterium]
MDVIVAKTAGFCFGVKRAVEQVYRQIEEGIRPIYTFGPIIHNEEVVRELEEKGVMVLNGEEELSRVKEGTVVIRSHGVPKRIYTMIEENGLHMVDATCPFVKKIHRIVEERGRAGHEIVIIGNDGHPEVEGICGWATGPVTVISTEEEAENFRSDPEKPLTVVSQTTFNYKKFDKLVEIICKMRYDTVDVMCTICSATEERQSEAREIAGKADCMIVIGGTHSSNTRKLFEICKTECANTYYIQTLKDLDIRLLPSMGCVGITAGASTPNNLIEEVSKHVRS